jgi:hypothetical protein
MHTTCLGVSCANDDGNLEELHRVLERFEVSKVIKAILSINKYLKYVTIIL